MIRGKLILPFILLIVFCSSATFAQTANDTINRSRINTKLVEELFLKELNELRAGFSLSKLEADNTLLKAADDQAAYCKAQNVVTHTQPGAPGKYDVKERVHYYGGNNGIVGENALMTFLYQQYTDTKTQKQVVIKTYKDLAHQLFEQWRNSPGHYKNMIAPAYSKMALGLALYDNRTVLYAVNVFASAPYFPPKNGLHYTDNTYGIAEMQPDKCKGFGRNDFLADIFSSYLIKIGDSVFQYYQNERTIKEMLTGPRDGIALDLVYKEQFKCMEPDNLNPSSVFDGYLLPPVYRDELFKNDVYSKTNEFMSFVGKIPPNAPRKDLQINAVVIQDGMACRYSFPVKIEDGILPDLVIDPQWCKATGKIKKDSANFVKQFFIPFQKNGKTTDSFYFEKLARLVKIFDGAITHIDINAYSSVEGTEVNNLELQTARASFIENFILQRIHQHTVINKKAIENWTLFREQMHGSGYQTMFSDSSMEKVRAAVNEHMKDPIVEDWLNEERVASITIYVNKDFDDGIKPNFLPLALYNSLAKGDTDQSRIEYSRLIDAYKNGEVDKYFLTAIEVPLERKNLPLISNYLASILLESDVFDYHDFNPRYYSYIDSAKRFFSSFKPLAFNLDVYKTHLYFRGMVNDVADFKKMETDILKFKKDTLIDQKILDHLLYNYYLTGSIYYEKLRAYDDMYVAFDKVKPYLSLTSLNEKEVYEVGKYFNYFFRFGQTIELLEKYLKKYPNNENLVYLYVNTGVIYNLNTHYHEAEFYKQLDRLAVMNRAKLCQWGNDNYQLIRKEEFEKKWCGYCNLK